MAKKPTTKRNCSGCGKPIPQARLQAIPDTVYCVKCAEANPEPPRHDPDEVCAKSSPSGQSGWSPKS